MLQKRKFYSALIWWRQPMQNNQVWIWTTAGDSTVWILRVSTIRTSSALLSPVGNVEAGQVVGSIAEEVQQSEARLGHHLRNRLIAVSFRNNQTTATMKDAAWQESYSDSNARTVTPNSPEMSLLMWKLPITFTSFYCKLICKTCNIILKIF